MLPLKIALRYFFSRKSHGAVNVISLISLAGVAVATMATVCVLSVFNGFSDLAMSRTSLIDPPIKVSPVKGKSIDNAEQLLRQLRQLPEVKKAVPVIEEMALASYRGRQMPVTVKGVPTDYEEIIGLKGLFIDSLPVDPLDGAILSVGTAVMLQAYPSQNTPISLYSPKRIGRINPANPVGAFRTDSLAITAVYQVDDQESDADRIIIPIANARRLFDYEHEATSIEISPKGGVPVKRLLTKVSDLIGSDNFIIADRVMQKEDAFKMINIEKWVTFVMLAFIMIIAAFNIISTLAMLIIEKEHDLDTLRILGASQQMLSTIFTYEGALITLCGGIIGIVIGVALSLAQQTFGFLKMGGDHSLMIIESYPVRVSLMDQVAVFLLVAVIAGLSALVARFMTPKRQIRS